MDTPHSPVVLSGAAPARVRRRFNNCERNPMLLQLVARMHSLKVNERQFFTIAHVYCFGTSPELTADVTLFKEKGVIPIYVQRFLKETSCK
jgi:hypothetical protein